jgi:hypothetical protein
MKISGQLHASAALLSGKKKARYPVDMRFGEPQNRYGRYAEMEMLFSL